MEGLARIAVAAIVFPLLAQESVPSDRLRALDQALAREVLRGTTPLPQPDVRAYVRSVGQRLAAEMPGAQADYVFDVLQNLDAAEPVALPAGAVYIPDQFFVAARNEAEFAGVLAHCMAHVALRHGIRPTEQPSNLASIPLVFMGGTHGMHSDASATQLLIPRGFLEAARKYELEADEVAVHAAARAGHSPEGLRDYVSRVQVQDGKFSALPNREERLGKLDAAIRAIGDVATSAAGPYKSVQAEVRRTIVESVPARRPPTLQR